MATTTTPIRVSESDAQLLKGLPLPLGAHPAAAPDEGHGHNRSEFLTNLLLDFENTPTDTLLLDVYNIYKAIVNDQPTLLEMDELNIPQNEWPQIYQLLAAKILRLFVQLNSTGPNIEFKTDASVNLSGDGGGISLTTRVIYEELDLREKLQLDGYEISELAVLPQLLIVAEELLKTNSGKPDIWIGKLHCWWCMRVLFLHQRILDGRSITLAGLIGCVGSAANPSMIEFEGDDDLTTLWHCEMADIHLYYYDIVSAKYCLSFAEKCCNAEFYTTGALGKKTRFQQKETAQLIVQANITESKENEANLVHLEEFRSCQALVNVPLDDDTRLEKVKITHTDDTLNNLSKLTTIQQILLLSELNFHKKSQPKDDLLKEGIIAYTQTLLDDPKIWCALVVGLLHRSMAETDHFRTVERSMMQFENIEKAISVEINPSFKARYQFYHAACMPLKWEVEVALADVLLSLGQVKGALDIYSKLKLWENVIACYNILELKHKAEEVIREQIQSSGETPKLLVYLGDATGDLSCFEKAWELSNHRNSLSRARLGVYWFKKQEYEKAIPYLQTAVELNPLEYPVWVRLGYAALRVENWKLCAKAYVHANSLDDESYENWNNLAKASLKLDNKDQALRALKQATKCNYEEWKIWENLMLVALQCCDLEWTIMAFNRLLDIKGSYVDETVLRLLVDLVCDDKWDKNGDSSTRCKEALQKLFGRLSSKVTTNAEVWQSYSTFLYNLLSARKREATTTFEEDWHKLVQYQQKAVRCWVQNKNWDKLPEITKKTVAAVELLCSRTRAYLDNLPDNAACTDLKTQAEYLHKQVANSIDKKKKEAIDPTFYEEFSESLHSALKILSGGV